MKKNVFIEFWKNIVLVFAGIVAFILLVCETDDMPSFLVSKAIGVALFLFLLVGTKKK